MHKSLDRPKNPKLFGSVDFPRNWNSIFSKTFGWISFIMVTSNILFLLDAFWNWPSTISFLHRIPQSLRMQKSASGEPSSQ